MVVIDRHVSLKKRLLHLLPGLDAAFFEKVDADPYENICVQSSDMQKPCENSMLALLLSQLREIIAIKESEVKVATLIRILICMKIVKTTVCSIAAIQADESVSGSEIPTPCDKALQIVLEDRRIKGTLCMHFMRGLAHAHSKLPSELRLSHVIQRTINSCTKLVDNEALRHYIHELSLRDMKFHMTKILPDDETHFELSSMTKESVSFARVAAVVNVQLKKLALEGYADGHWGCSAASELRSFLKKTSIYKSGSIAALKIFMMAAQLM
eukprot:3758713-Pleurochrysis_carterae.AAC.1